MRSASATASATTHEITAAQSVAARAASRRHVIVDIDLRVFGGSALTADIAVPKGRVRRRDVDGHSDHLRAGAQHDLPVVRARAGPRCSTRSDIFIGVNALDYSGYPDCRPEYIAAFERMANLATQGRRRRATAVTIHAPLHRI